MTFELPLLQSSDSASMTSRASRPWQKSNIPTGLCPPYAGLNDCQVQLRNLLQSANFKFYSFAVYLPSPPNSRVISSNSSLRLSAFSSEVLLLSFSDSSSMVSR